MGTTLLATVGGALICSEHAAQKWKLDCKGLYSAVPKLKRFSFAFEFDQPYQVCNVIGSSPHQNNGCIGLNMIRNAWSPGSYGLKTVSTLPKCKHTGRRKFISKPFLHSPIVFRQKSFRESVTPQISSDFRDESKVEETFGESEEVLEGGCVQETLLMLEWPAICTQVAQFASTPMGVKTARDANLAIGTNRLESEALLKQTADACTLDNCLDFSGIENLESFITGAVAGNVCQTKDLCIVKNTLIQCQHVCEQLFGRDGDLLHASLSNGESCTSLQSLMLDCSLCSDLVFEIDRCLDCTLDTILDRASPALAAARLGRQENMRTLQALLKETATRIVQQGGMDSVIVTVRRARLCIAVRSSHKSLLPGGLVLDISNTGTTSFMEPEPALKLNNEESRLADVEKFEEMAVLKRLTQQLLDNADAIMVLLKRITMIDLACARASHAKWLGAVVPFFNEEYKEDKMFEHFMVDIVGLCHPLLLGTALTDLPISQRCGSTQSSGSLQVTPQSRRSVFPDLPVPVDIKVNSNIRVVTITGPNTGGKTATLKALGIASIMAKAGLYLPAKGQPKLPWFDMVLADVGDAQSLERNLSTFSGHIRRLCAILEVCTNQSFILLDEIGGGTDPSEGAALATAVLQHLCSKVLLTIATTHSAELKTLKDQDVRFENASVEFDVKTLRPTYRVLWGIAGQSSALDIAKSLGFDMEVLTRAREIVGNIEPSGLGAGTAKVLIPIMQQRDEMLERSRKAADVLLKATNLNIELRSATENLPKRVAAWKRSEEHTMQIAVASARLLVDQAIERFQTATEGNEPADELPSLRDIHAEVGSILENVLLKQASTPFPHIFSIDDMQRGIKEEAYGAPILSVGDKVLVRSLGETPVTIIEKNGDFLKVQLGKLVMQVRPNDVLKTKKSATPAIPEKISYKSSKRIVQNQTKDESDTEIKYETAVQTSKNTLDLRGMRVEDSLRVLDLTLASKRRGSVLFVIHGFGTGALKEAVLQNLQKHPFVGKYEDESITNTGCTVVYVK